VLREKLAALPTPERVKLAARFRPGDLASPAGAAMAAVARRHQALTAEIAQLDAGWKRSSPTPPQPASWQKRA
jgi:hypothetical protein